MTSKVKVSDIIERLRAASNSGKTIVLLDYDTNADVENAKKPLSHASLIKAYAEGTYPYDNVVVNNNNASKENVRQLDLFNQ